MVEQRQEATDTTPGRGQKQPPDLWPQGPAPLLGPGPDHYLNFDLHSASTLVVRMGGGGRGWQSHTKETAPQTNFLFGHFQNIFICSSWRCVLPREQRLTPFTLQYCSPSSAPLATLGEGGGGCVTRLPRLTLDPRGGLPPGVSQVAC